MNPKSKDDLITVVKSILVTIWDPLRLQQFAQSKNPPKESEYDFYIKSILQMLREKKGEDDFRQHLLYIEQTRMGRQRSLRRADAAAQLWQLEAQFDVSGILGSHSATPPPG